MMVQINDTYGVGAYDSNIGLEGEGYYINFTKEVFLRFDTLTFGTDRTYIEILRVDGYNGSDTAIALFREGSYYYFALRYAYYNGTDIEWFEGEIAVSYPIQTSTWYKLGLHWSMLNTTSKVSIHELYVNDDLEGNATLTNADDDQVSAIYVGSVSGNVTAGTFEVLAYYDDVWYGDDASGSSPPSAPVYGEQIINGGFETGDSTNWSSVLGATTQYNHSGAYSLNIYSMGTPLWTNTLSGIAYGDIFSMGFWYGNFAGGSANDTIWYIKYSDGTNTTGSSVHSDVWVYVDLLSYMNPAKLVVNLGIQGTTGNPSWVDDFTLTGTGSSDTYDFSWVSSPVLPVSFTVNGTTYPSPLTINVSDPTTYSFNATSSLMTGGTYYYFDAWLINGTTLNSTNALTLYLDGNSSFLAYYLPYIPSPPSSGGTYYFRSDSHTVNNVTAYQLDTTNTASPLDANETDITSGLTVTWGFRVYLLHDGGTLTELSSTYIAQITRSVNGYGYLNNTWVAPTTSLVIGFDSIEVRVYTRFGSGSWVLKGTFTTPRLLKKSILTSTWMFQVYVAKSTGSTVSTFRFGDTSTANSYLTGVLFQDPNTFDLMQYNLNIGNFFTFIMLPYTALIGNLVYGLVLLILTVPTYVKYHSIDLITFELIIFGGSGGFFSLLMPSSGLQWGFVLMAFSLGALLYKTFTSR